MATTRMSGITVRSDGRRSLTSATSAFASPSTSMAAMPGWCIFRRRDSRKYAFRDVGPQQPRDRGPGFAASCGEETGLIYRRRHSPWKSLKHHDRGTNALRAQDRVKDAGEGQSCSASRQISSSLSSVPAAKSRASWLGSIRSSSHACSRARARASVGSRGACFCARIESA